MKRQLLATCCALVATACGTLRTEPTPPAVAGAKSLRELKIDLPAALREGLGKKDDRPEELRKAKIELQEAKEQQKEAHDAGQQEPAKIKLDAAQKAVRTAEKRLSQAQNALEQASLEQLIMEVDLRRDKTIRNSVLSQLIAASTANCSIYLQGLRGGQVTARLSSDLAATTFGIAGSLTEPVRSAKILAGLAAASTSAGASIDRTVFAQQGAELIADAVVQLRNEGRQRLETKMQQDDLSKWTMGLAIADFYEFHGDCSMLRGLSRMREAIATREQEVRAIRTTAAAIARSGGSGTEVAAAVAGVSSTLGRKEETSSSTPSSSMGLDLELMRGEALKCFDIVKDQVDVVATSTLEDPTASITDLAALKDDGKCSKTADGWTRRFARQAGKAISDITIVDNALKAAHDTAKTADEKRSTKEGELKDARKKLADANAIADPAIRDPAVSVASAEEKKAITALEEADAEAKKAHVDLTTRGAERRTRFKVEVEAKRFSVISMIDADTLYITNARTSAHMAIKDATRPQTADGVVQILKSVAGPQLQDQDPAFLLAIAAAAKVAAMPEQKDNAALASTLARNAMRDYIDSSK
ncbi:hypothetical protein [Caulobacter sp.]|uniref:hypothetical protein n=1 Tax=Caulobacter sp. TaxID=78 RepID=UPI001B24153F|nr:hypothetical protein [Caulobacter sp.]MBO9547068.1 hypothetical protein [Caulobacter sp.]